MVTARKPNEDIIPAQTLSGEELHRLNSNSVADALRYFSGVQVKDYGGVGGIKTVNIHSSGYCPGFSPDSLLMLLNVSTLGRQSNHFSRKITKNNHYHQIIHFFNRTAKTANI